MIELSRLRGNERYATCSDDVMAHWPYGSIQDRICLLYTSNAEQADHHRKII